MNYFLFFAHFIIRNWIWLHVEAFTPAHLLYHAGGLPVAGGCRTTCRHGGRFTAGSPPWRDDGCFERINHALVMADRERVGRDASPTAAIIDSQSAKTTEAGGPRGYDLERRSTDVSATRWWTRTGAASRSNRIRRVSKTAMVADASVSLAVHLPIHPACLRRQRICRGKVTTATLIAVEIVRKNPDQVGFAVNPRRWVVERFFAWIGRNRRLAKDFEATIDSARAFLYAASVMLLVRRIARAS
jgi:transposase